MKKEIYESEFERGRDAGQAASAKEGAKRLLSVAR